MAKIKYTPFLKLKSNEVGALAVLPAAIKEWIVPFFDLPRKDGMTAKSYQVLLEKSARKVEKNLGEAQPFFLDNFDIPDDVAAAGASTYASVIQRFQNTSFIPVLGLDRSPHHVNAVFLAKGQGIIQSDVAAIRLLEEDFDSFALIESDIQDLIDRGIDFSSWRLILDSRMCSNVNVIGHAKKLADFIAASRVAFNFSEIIVAGSSVPASIGEAAKSNQTTSLDRTELQLFREIQDVHGLDDIGFGDYTVVSPMYSDISIPPEMMQNVMAPKIIYSDDLHHHIWRGGALKTHARGSLQYNDIALQIVSQSFYRGSAYSYGDAYLDQKAKLLGSGVTPSSILKPTINAHISYMATDHPLLQ
ncbi:beta family protein [Variovorax sp. N23]|uniref:beta family protein n=1 Tax=Variovorax sp. N23 TaxID=2980555 RepID=UPI0021C64B7C|nr:beta family protein [Variovorax sp. N23]MCU4119844.1 beta family protein [Variovorax sp. N23]